jgi:hypothetical protein
MKQATVRHAEEHRPIAVAKVRRVDLQRTSIVAGGGETGLGAGAKATRDNADCARAGGPPR